MIGCVGIDRVVLIGCVVVDRVCDHLRLRVSPSCELVSLYMSLNPEGLEATNAAASDIYDEK